MTVGYWSGYLAGICTGTFVGWIISSLWGEKDSDDAPDVDSNDSSNGQNIIYFRFTDRAFSEVLARLREDRSSSETETAPEAATVPECRSASPEPNDNVTPIGETMDSEMADIFEEEDRLKSKTRDEILDIGRKAPTRPVSYLTSTTGGYATMGQLEDIGKKYAEYKDSMITRSEELEIIHAFRGIVGQRYYDAQALVKAQGYILHPLYVGNGPKRPAQFYSPSTLGVRIRDDEDNGVPGIDAVITEIVDIGGVDAKNKGASSN